MAKHEVLIKQINVMPHDNADRLEIAQIDGYQCVVAKGKFDSGDLVAYIPEDSIVPEWLLEKLGLVGMLAGPDKNRVKTVRLRGVTSQGLCYPVKWDEDGLPYLELEPENFDNRYYLYDHPPVDREVVKSRVTGVNVKSALGIEKYEPPIPVHMTGELFNARGNTLRYDIENYKKYPNVLEEGEEVVMTEKIHGTWCCIGVVPEEKANGDAGRLIITSKGLSAKGLAFKLNEKNDNNLYVRAARKSGLMNRLPQHTDGYMYVLGEVFGHKVQDLDYGKGRGEIGFRAFDVYVGDPSGTDGRYLNNDELENVLSKLGIDRVPVVFQGPFSKETMLEATDGKDTLSETHVREGVVVRPLKERRDTELGRVQLKSVSDDYLTRRKGTEYH